MYLVEVSGLHIYNFSLNETIHRNSFLFSTRTFSNFFILQAENPDFRKCGYQSPSASILNIGSSGTVLASFMICSIFSTISGC